MGTHTKSIEVDRPISTVYNQWTQFESFPQFMEGVESVKQLDDRRLHWQVQVGTERREFDATITEQEPERRIGWRATDGPEQAGVVTFEPVAPDRTRVSLALDFDPEGFKEQAGDALGFVSRRIEGDLGRFKEFIETRGAETGAWRGSIGTDSQRPDLPGAGR